MQALFNKIFPQIVCPPVIAMVHGTEWSYTKVLQEINATQRKVQLVLAAITVVMLSIIQMLFPSQVHDALSNIVHLFHSAAAYFSYTPSVD